MNETRVHPTALVEPGVQLGARVFVGPFCHLAEGVRVGDDSRLIASVTLLGPTTLGARNVVHPYAVLGGAPQDRTYAGEPTTLVLGDDNEVREHVTIHRGTAKGGGETRIGHRGLFMAGSHIAHDCVIGDEVVLANATLLAGHVTLGDAVVSGGRVGLVPFVKVGRMAFLAGASVVERDVPPFVIASGDRARVRAPNVVGLRRNGVPEANIVALESAFRAIFVGKREVPAEVRGDPFVQELMTFVAARAQGAAGER